MESLQKTIYRMLPPSIKQEIITKPDSYPEYADIIGRLNQEILEQTASKIRSRVKLTRKNLELMSVLLSIYYHIKSHPPQNFPGKWKSVHAWDNFSSVDYPQYEEYIEEVERWPKYMFLIYYTYRLCYEKWYNLRPDTQLRQYVLPFNRRNDKLINYIYDTYQHLNRSISLDQFRFYGY